MLLIEQIYDTPCFLYCSNDSTRLNKSASTAKNSCELSGATTALLLEN